jgi:hypothetical protein
MVGWRCVVAANRPCRSGPSGAQATSGNPLGPWPHETGSQQFGRRRCGKRAGCRETFESLRFMRSSNVGPPERQTRPGAGGGHISRKLPGDGGGGGAGTCLLEVTQKYGAGMCAPQSAAAAVL